MRIVVVFVFLVGRVGVTAFSPALLPGSSGRFRHASRLDRREALPKPALPDARLLTCGSGRRRACTLAATSEDISDAQSQIDAHGDQVSS